MGGCQKLDVHCEKNLSSYILFKCKKIDCIALTQYFQCVLSVSEVALILIFSFLDQ